MRLIHPIFSHMSKNQDQDKSHRICTERAKRYIMSCKEQCKKDNCTYNKYPPVKSNDHAYRSSNSLSTAKFHRNRKIVAEDTSQCCIKGKKRKDTIHGISINHSHVHNSQYTLQAVSQQGDRSRFLSKGPEGIRSTRIPAAMISDICLVDLSNNIACLKKPAYITDNKTNNTFHTFIPFPRARG